MRRYPFPFSLCALALCIGCADATNAATSATGTGGGSETSSPDSTSSPDGTGGGGNDQGGEGEDPVQWIELDRGDYEDKLAAMWMAESIANWTGLITEGRHTQGPYLNDDAWGEPYDHQRPGSAEGVLDFNFQDPWLSDDDTDIEYISLAAMSNRGDPYLSPEDIQAAWFDHTEPGQFIWVSNLQAQSLMRESPPVLPPSTSLLAANDQSLMIDSQLTTEMFGALSPGMPQRALALAELPIRIAASGYAEHAAQFFVILFSLAPVVDGALAPSERTLWLTQTARRFIPDESKTAEIYDFVEARYLSNPNSDDWEETRDALAERFGPESSNEAGLYLEWYESPINFATGIMALLYGAGDLRRTIQIGTLSGWDSDNGTASMGGLLGLLLGSDGVRAQFPEQIISVDYQIVTRSGFDSIDDSFPSMAGRMMPLLDRVVVDAGGFVESRTLRIPVEDLSAIDSKVANRRVADGERSLNNRARRAGGEIGVSLGLGTITQEETVPGYFPSSAEIEVVADGLELDTSGIDRRIAVRSIDEFPGDERAPYHAVVAAEEGRVMVEITYPAPETIDGVRFVDGPAIGGSLSGVVDVSIEARVDGQWLAVAAEEEQPSSASAFAVHLLRFEALEVDAIRLSGAPPAGQELVTICEVDGVIAP